MRFDFAVLGALRVTVDGRPLDIAAGRQKTLLATLLLRAGRPVDRADLIDRIWNDAVPAKPTPALHSLMLRLRRTLADEGGKLIRAHGTGYLITAEPDDVDVGRFEALWTQAQAAAATGAAERRAALMREAMAMWRGEPLADVRSDVLHRVDVPPLVERREQAAEEHFEAELDTGRHVAVVPLLREAIARSPLREGLWRQLMVALFRGGRQAEALDTYRELAKVLDAELGLVPGPALRQLQRDILNGDPALLRPATPAVAISAVTDGPLFQLPADPGPLPGRDRAITTLRRVLTGGYPGPPPLACVTGPPGAGKTALAVHVAHAVRDDFPDGQWYLSLGGHQPATSAVDPQVELLRYAGIVGGAVPAAPEARAAMLRAALAKRRVLIVLDDAASAEQVGPLLPGTGRSAVVVTARSRLGGLVALHGARALEIGPLDPPDAMTLLEGMFRQHGPMLPPDLVEELARHCGYLPLALRIAAANLASGTAADAVHYVQRLRDGDRLGGLSVDGEPGLAMRAAIEPSYQRLDEGARRALRLQASSPADDFTTADIAALLDIGRVDAAAIVRTLAAVHCIRPSQPGRFVTHDLIRLYALEASRREDTGADRIAATSRLLHSYLSAADTLDRPQDTQPAICGGSTAR